MSWAVYNIGGGELRDMKSVNDMILEQLGCDDSHVTYLESEPMTTKDQVIDAARAVAELDVLPTDVVNTADRRPVTE